MKKSLSIILSILLAFSAFSVMPVSAFAEETYDLKVGGTQVTSENCENIPAAAGYEEYSGKASFDATTNTLTLENYTYKGKGAAFGNGQEGFGIAIGFSSQTTLVLKGTNTITVTSHNNNGDSYGIICGNGSLLIKGNGVLNVTSAPVSTESYGISIGVYANNALTIEGGTINATGDAGRKSYGIKAFDEISITEDAVSVSAAGQTCAFAVLLGDDYRTLTTGKGGYAYTDVEGTENETVIPHGVHNHTELAAYKKITLDRVIHNFSGKTCSYCGAKNPDYVFTGSASDLAQGDKFQMGMYPQTKVTDSETLTALAAIDCTMTSYGYIANYNKDNGNYDNVDMTYADIAYNGDLYRKVNINEYRPSDTTQAPIAGKSNQDNNGYEAGNTYYFKWEPVVWQVLAKEADGVRVMSESLLDSQDFYKCTSDTITWETGDLRSWLNGDFCNAVFSEGEKGKIVPDTHENGLGNNTTDTLWLLSQSEVTNSAYGFSSDKNNKDVARRAQGTDYAKSQGITVPDLGCSEWSLRSVVFKNYVGYNNNYIVQVHGEASSICGFGNTELGVRPAFKLDLNATVSSSVSPVCRITGEHDYGDGYVCTICGNEKEVTSVRNYADLKELARQVNAGVDFTGKTVTLENDIICKNDENDAEYATDWTPIGNDNHNFTGSFDGKGYTITGLNNTSVTTNNYAGLFGYIGSGGKVKNVSIENCNIKGQNYVGGVAGVCYDCEITNCTVTGAVSGSGGSVGGVVGSVNNGSTITNCCNTGAVSGSESVGGIAGFVIRSKVTNCYNTGAVSDIGNYAGGVTGFAMQNSEITNCYNTGAVSGSSSVGGVTGEYYNSQITNCYSAGAVSGSGGSVGGVVGASHNSGNITNCYYDRSVCTISGAAKENNWKALDDAVLLTVTGLTTAQMTGLDAIGTDRLDFQDGANGEYSVGDVWTGKGNNDFYSFYPHLKGFKYDSSKSVEDWPAKAENTNTEVYHISDYEELKLFAKIVNGGKTNAKAELTEDIICKNDDNDTDYATDWTPIGINNEKKFTGSFDGKGHTITGLSTPEDFYDYAGLFGYVYGGTVENVGIEDGTIRGRNYVGNVAGCVYYGTLKNCYSTGSVIGKKYVGGVAGYFYGGDNKATLKNCYNTGAVSGSDYVSGVAGCAYHNATVEDCYNSGEISGTSNYVGGISGTVENNSTVKNCYNSGKVSCTENTVGGIATVVINNSKVINCYNSGSVSGNIGCGGIVSALRFNSTIENCYNTGTVSGVQNIGGVVGFLDTKQNMVTNVYNAGVVSGNGHVAGVVGYANTNNTITNCYYDKSNCPGISAITSTKDTDTVKGLTTAEMTGVNALSNMAFSYEEGTNSPWLVKPDEDGYWYYPHLKGFDFKDADGKRATPDTEGAVQMSAEDIESAYWPAKAEISITWNGDSTYTYSGSSQRIVPTSVKVGGIALTESVGYDVKYMKKDNYGSWVETNNTINAGEYRTVIYFLRAVVVDEDIQYTVDDGHFEFTKDFEINPKSISGFTVKLSADSVTYNGNDNRPSVESVNDDTTTLTANTDYTISYTEGDWEVAGNYKVTVTGKGNYKDSVEKTFTIDKKAVTITAKSAEKPYDGNPLTESGFTVSALETGDTHSFNVEMSPESTITDFGSINNIIASVDGVSVGSAGAIETGNYNIAIVNGTLKINKADATVTITGHNNTTVFDGDEHSVSNYDFSSTNTLYTTNDFTFSGTAEAKRTVEGTTFMGLNKDQFQNNNTNFNVIFSIVDGYQKITTQPMDEKTLDVSVENVTYDGESKEPVVKVGDTVLEKDKDYTVSYKDENGKEVDGINGAGTYNVTITGKGNYSGEATKAVTVEPIKITVTADNQTSTVGEALKELTYKLEGKPAEGDDLGITVSTTANKDKAGKYPITAKVANANYKATIVDGVYTVNEVPDFTPEEKEEAENEINSAAAGTTTSKAVTIYWGKTKKAKYFEIYATYCGRNDFKKIATVGGNVTKYDITKLFGKKLDQTKNVKAYVIAYGDKGKLSRSLNLHVAGFKTKFSNVKKIKLKKNKLTIKAGKTKKIKGKIVLEDKKKKPVNHVKKLRFRSSNKKIATVTKSGKVKAKKKGTCWIYVYANNGMAKKVKITVK